MHVQSCSRCCVLVQLQFIQARRSHYAHGTVKGGQGGPTVTARVTCHDGTLFAQAGNEQISDSNMWLPYPEYCADCMASVGWKMAGWAGC